MSEQAMIRLNNGVGIPQLGFGVFQIPVAATQQAVEAALEAGYRHIDTAAAYNNEAGVGAALQATGIPRDEVFVTTKLRNGEHGFDATLQAYDASLDRLGLDHVDLYLVHWPNPTADRYVDSWRALEKINGEQQVRAIGVSNFLAEHLDRLRAETEIVPAVNQIELHPSYQQRDLAAECRRRGIAVEAYSPLGQATDLEQPGILELADRHRVSPAQVVLRWQLQSGNIAIPKSATPDRIRANADLDHVALSAAEMQAVAGLESGRRIGNDPRTFSLSQIR